MKFSLTNIASGLLAMTVISAVVYGVTDNDHVRKRI